MGRLQLLVSACAAALLLPGCLSDEAPPTTAVVQPNLTTVDGQVIPTAEALASGEAGLEVPVWKVGDYWEYNLGGVASGVNTFVVAAATGSSYELLTGEVDVAQYDAVHDISFLGTINAASLEGRQGDVPVRFLDFPLVDNKTWTTTWDGEEVTITAKLNRAPANPFAGGLAFDMVVMNSTGAETIRYQYAPAARWFTSLEFLNGGGGSFTLTLAKAGRGYRGEVYRGEATPIAALDSTGGVPASAEGTFPVENETQTVYVSLGYGGLALAQANFLVDPTQKVHELPTGPTVMNGGGYENFLPGVVGEWRYSFQFAGTPGSSGYGARLMVVSVTPVPVG
ncbi:MAG TPA: hypothetical protein VNZ52_13825 [Candidatus Thermoplasmatota archaeon]|nr:hypothetical protein [Candidatus Thermoplasmatota archaeon]